MANPDYSEASKTKVGLFLAHYGNFIAIWSAFELMLEILIMRELRLDNAEASIVCAGRPVSVKMDILEALLLRDPDNKTKVQKIAHLRNIGERNSFLHGFFRVNRAEGIMLLIRRELKHGYRAYKKERNYEQMEEHLGKFHHALLDAQSAFDVWDKHFDAYTEPIEELAIAQEAQEARHRESRSSSGRASRKRRAKAGR